MTISPEEIERRARELEAERRAEEERRRRDEMEAEARRQAAADFEHRRANWNCRPHRRERDGE
jgi:hypothetical protein